MIFAVFAYSDCEWNRSAANSQDSQITYGFDNGLRVYDSLRANAAKGLLGIWPQQPIESTQNTRWTLTMPLGGKGE